MIYQFPFLFWLQMAYFWVCIFLAFFIPGNIFFQKQKLNFITKLVLSVGVGMVLWGFQGFLFGYVHIRWMSYAYLIVAIGYWAYITLPLHVYNPFKKFSFAKHRLMLFLLFVGCLVQLVTIWFNGVPTTKGAYYCCGDEYDNIVHIAITQSVINSIPPMEPGMNGVLIKNYHYFGSIIVGELIRVFDLPLIQTDYQYMPILITLLLGLSIITFGKVLFIADDFINWLLFFMYFGGDFVYGLRFITTRTLSFDMSSLEDGSKFLANYPRAFAIDIFIIGLIILLLWIKQKKNKTLGILLAIVLGSIISLKVYVGIFAIVGIVALATFYALRKNFSLIPYAIGVIALSLVLYLPVNAGAGGLYFTGFWLFENYVTQPGFGLIRLELARTIYQQHNNYLRVWSYELLYGFLYLLSIFWTKILGIFQTKKSLSYFPTELHVFLMPGLSISLITGLFFQQGTGGANTFNFLVSVFILGSFYASLACFYWLSKIPKKLRIIIVIVIVVITIPRVVVETMQNFTRVFTFQGFIVPADQVKIFAYMKQHVPDNATVLVDQRGALEVDRATPYVFIYTNNNIYLSGQGNDLSTHGVDFTDRQSTVDIIKGGDRCRNASLLYNMPVQYILSDFSPYSLSSASSKFFTKQYTVGQEHLFKIDKNAAKALLEDLNKDPTINCDE